MKCYDGMHTNNIASRMNKTRLHK